MALDAIPAWLASVIADKLLDAGIAAARDQLKELPPTEDQLKKYIVHIKSKTDTIPHKISCNDRNADLHAETFFLWPKLEAERKEQDKSLNEAMDKHPQEPIEAQDLLFRPPPGKTLFAIEGPAGVGKTTLARSLVYWAAKETLKLLEGKAAEAKLARPYLPIYLDASDLAKIAEGQSLSTIGWSQLPNDWGLLLVVDGLDEIEQSLRTRALERMKGPWLQGADRNLIFMFGRPGSVRSISWESREERILALDLRPWTFEEVKGYLDKWVQEGFLQKKEEAERILQHVKQNFGPDVVPLHIYLLVCDYLGARDFENLPKTRLELYETYLIYATLYEAESLTAISEGTAHPLSEEEILALSCLELAIKENPELESYIHQSRASCNARALKNLQRKWNTYCKDRVSSRIAWNELLQLWQKRGLCWLGHKSFHDFLAAKALAKIYEGKPRDFWLEWIRPKIFDTFWTDTLVYAIVLLSDKDRILILNGLLELSSCDPISRETKRHHSVIAKIINKSINIYANYSDILDKWRKQEPAANEAVKAYKVVPEWVIEYLSSLTQHKNPLVSIDAIETLAKVGKINQAVSMLYELSKSEDPLIFMNAISALARMAKIYKEAIFLLKELAHNSKNPWVKAIAATALSPTYSAKGDMETKHTSIRLTQPSLIELVRTKSEFKRRKNIKSQSLTLKSLADLNETLATIDDPWEKLGLAEGFLERNYSILKNLEDTPESDPDSEINKFIKTIFELTQSNEPLIRYWTTELLIRIGKRAYWTLEELVLHGDPPIRNAAAKALAEVEHPPLGCKELLETKTPNKAEVYD